MRLTVVQTTVQTVQPEREGITYLLEQLLWVEVLKNCEHLGKVVLKDRRGAFNTYNSY